MKQSLILIVIATLLTGCAVAGARQKENPMSHFDPSTPVNMTGKTISPYILYHAAQQMRSLSVGDVLLMETDIFKAVDSDIRAWCRMAGHQIAQTKTKETSVIYHIQKGAPKTEQRSLAMIISDASLERLLSPLGLALSAAISGRQVYLYFQGPATRLLKKGYSASLEGLSRPFTGFAKSALAKAGHLPAEEKLVQLKELGALFYICGGSMDHFGVKEADLVFDDVIQAEYFTILEVIETADVQVVLQ
jgi:predicted peroxiredoxin/TusA-related sulfurtransferase